MKFWIAYPVNFQRMSYWKIPKRDLRSPVNFLTDTQWGSIVKLSKLDTLVGLDTDIEATPKLWRALLTSSHPERQKLPGDWKYKSLIEQVCILRAMRPDRLISSMRCFIENNLGTRFIHVRQTGFEKTFEEINSTTHTFFTLSPGVDPMRDIEKLGLKMNVSFDANNLYSISLGQGENIQNFSIQIIIYNYKFIDHLLMK